MMIQIGRRIVVGSALAAPFIRTARADPAHALERVGERERTAVADLGGVMLDQAQGVPHHRVAVRPVVNASAAAGPRRVPAAWA